MIGGFTVNSVDFQYPVFGSSVCNPYDAALALATVELSVPCVRVECLQL